MMNKDDYTLFIKACQKAASFDLFRCSSGNMSWRFDDQHAALSGTQCWLAELTREQIAICRIEDGKCINSVKPTAEKSFHLGILRVRPDINVVLHFQSQYATAVACGDAGAYNFNVILEIPFYIGEPAVVGYYPPGSAELAEAIVEKMKDHDLAIMKNHGIVTVGKDFKEAIQRAVFFELACSILFNQKNPEYLSAASIEFLSKAETA